jgi:hypothetical protein
MSEEHEMEELQEAAESGREHSNLAPVSLTMAILAVLVAIAALLGHRAHTEEVLLQDKATDTWNYYQAKNIRAHTADQMDELLKVIPLKDASAAKALIEKNEAANAKSKTERDELFKEGKSLEAEVDMYSHRADRYDLGETLLEVGLVVCSITLMTKKRHFWLVGILCGLAGVVATAIGLMIH